MQRCNVSRCISTYISNPIKKKKKKKKRKRKRKRKKNKKRWTEREKKKQETIREKHHFGPLASVC